MAAYKKATLATFPSSNAMKVKRVIFKRRVVLKGVRVFKPSSRGMARVSRKRTWEITKLKNGLLDTTNTPPWMVEVVKRNATESPLLRLPGELRNKIWRYATTGNIINIREDEDETRVDAKSMEKVVIVCKGHTVGVVGQDNPMKWLSTRVEGKTRLPTAFRLHEVSRQIYDEVSTLPYSDSIFFFCSWDDECELIKEWTCILTPAHKNAISDIAIDEMNFECYLENGYKIRKVFPSLRRLHLNTNRVNTVYDQGYDEKDKNFWRHELKRLEEMKQKRIDRREGGDVKLVWHENPIEDYEMWVDTDDESKADSSFSSDDDSSDNDGPEEDSGRKWNVDTQEDSEGENETEYHVGADNEDASNSESDSTQDDDDLGYDSDMLDLGPF